MHGYGSRVVSATVIGLGVGLTFYEVFFYLVKPWETFSTLGAIFLGLAIRLVMVRAPIDRSPGWKQLTLALVAVPVLGAVLGLGVLEGMPNEHISPWFYVMACAPPALATWVTVQRDGSVANAMRLSLCTAALTPAWAMAILMFGLALSGGGGPTLG